MEKKFYFYQFDFTNGIAIRVQATSFKHAIVKAESFFGKDKMLSVIRIHNIDLNLHVDIE